MPNLGPRHPYDTLGTLLPLSWRGIEIPCYSTDLDVAHRLTEHNQYGVAGGYQENGFRSSGVFTFKLLLRNGISGYKFMYPEIFRDVLDALYDSSAGTLVHPEFGELQCKVSTFSVHWDPTKRDGADIDVTWKEHIEGPGQGLENAPLNTSGAVSFVDLTASAREIDVEWEDDEGSNPLDVLSGLEGRLLMAQMDVAAQIAKLGDAISAVNNVIDTLESVSDPKAWGVSNAAKEILTALGDTLANVTPDKRKRITQKVSDQRQPVSKAAGKWSMSTEDFLMLNPSSALTGYLENGDEFFVFEAS